MNRVCEDPNETLLDMAQVYLEMFDAASAKATLQEVGQRKPCTEEQRARATELELACVR